MNARINIIFNSTVLYLLAFLLSTFFHEVAHALAGLWFGSDPVLHHNYVEHSNDASTIAQVIIALAGPLTSLILGCVSGGMFFKSKYRGLTQLFMLWFAILGLNNFLGYLMTGPIFSVGDIGKVYQLLGWSVWTQILIALTGAALLLLMAYKLTKPFLEFSIQHEWIASEKARKSYSFGILMLPWMIGSVIITLLYLPIIAFISIIYPISSGMIFIFPWQNAVNVMNAEPSTNQSSHQVSYVWLAALIIAALIFRLVLAPGISL